MLGRSDVNHRFRSPALLASDVAVQAVGAVYGKYRATASVSRMDRMPSHTIGTRSSLPGRFRASWLAIAALVVSTGCNHIKPAESASGRYFTHTTYAGLPVGASSTGGGCAGHLDRDIGNGRAGRDEEDHSSEHLTIDSRIFDDEPVRRKGRGE